MAIPEDFGNGVDADQPRSGSTKLTEKVDLVIMGGEDYLGKLESDRTESGMIACHGRILTNNSWTARSTFGTARTTAWPECLYSRRKTRTSRSWRCGRNHCSHTAVPGSSRQR